MKAYIVCEGKLDVQLLKWILPSDLLKDVYLVDAGSLYDVTSLACSLVVKTYIPHFKKVIQNQTSPSPIN